MPLLIDGHNLIGAGVFEDIRITDEDDEAQLVARLRVWRSRYRGPIVVIFDHGITEGRSSSLSGGGVKAIFARNPTDADDLIRRRIRRPQKDLVLVTNDAVLRQEAQIHDVEVWRPVEFVQRMMDPPAPSRKSRKEGGTENQVDLTAREVDQWMRLFQEENRNGDNPVWTPPFQRPKRRRLNRQPGSQRKQKRDGRRKR